MDSNENNDLNIYKQRKTIEEVDNNEIIEYKKIKNKKRKNSKNYISDENSVSPSEEKEFNIRDKLRKEETNVIDYTNKEKEKEVMNDIEGTEVMNQDKKEGKKGYFGINFFGWISYLYNEIPYLWKKEELVKGYDANGNVVYRPKKKIPLKENNNRHDINKMNAENEANSAGVDYSQKGINYGIYFN